jgi:hypothetical protein
MLHQLSVKTISPGTMRTGGAPERSAVKKIMHAHEGDLDIDNPDRGLTFRATMAAL